MTSLAELYNIQNSLAINRWYKTRADSVWDTVRNEEIVENDALTIARGLRRGVATDTNSTQTKDSLRQNVLQADIGTMPKFQAASHVDYGKINWLNDPRTTSYGQQTLPQQYGPEQKYMMPSSSY